jgi:tRNA(Ile)-lysidine synthase
VAVAYSGGRDSTALLHATLTSARRFGLRVCALHVHHGLHPQADAWLRHCETTCQTWARDNGDLRFVATRLRDRPAPGESVEAWARQQRYCALRSMALAEGASLVLLAHHRRDQAETFVLQALRGAGMAGQAAMPRAVERAGLHWVRPWIDLPRTAIDAYVELHGLAHIEDDSNDDVRFARNRLRRQVWPALTAAFPDAERTLSTAAAWAQQAREAIDELARLDVAQVSSDASLDLAAWSALSAARRSHALRAWLAAQTGRMPDAKFVERLLREMVGPDPARWPVPKTNGELLRYRGHLRLRLRQALHEEDQSSGVAGELRVLGAGTYALAGWAGRLSVEPTDTHGITLSRLACVQLRSRSGGEQFQLGPRRPARSLKKQYQSLGIAAPDREGPLVFIDDALVFAPGLGIDARAWAPAGAPQVALRWLPCAASLPGSARAES